MRFRLQALVHQGEPDELDIVPRLVRPRAVVAAVVLGIAVAAAIVWSFVGQLPRQVTEEGLLVSDSGLNTVQSADAGLIQKVNATSQQKVTAGQVIATVMDAAGNPHPERSPFTGQVITVSVSAGQPVQVGTPLVSIGLGNAAGHGMHAVLFVPSSKASQIGPGMSVQMAVDAAPSAAFGLLRGKVSAIDPYPVTTGQALALLGNDLLVEKFLKADSVQLITVTLEPDRTTGSGYSWTTKNGPPFPLSPQGLLSATVRVGNEHPITFVFGS